MLGEEMNDAIIVSDGCELEEIRFVMRLGTVCHPAEDNGHWHCGKAGVLRIQL